LKIETKRKKGRRKYIHNTENKNREEEGEGFFFQK
jgi:hypothetical protein